MIVIIFMHHTFVELVLKNIFMDVFFQIVPNVSHALENPLEVFVIEVS